MNLSSSCLLLSGVASFLIALLHLALAPGPRWYRHFGADELAQLHEQGSRFFSSFRPSRWQQGCFTWSVHSSNILGE
jgi:hypothetical protein